MAKCYLFSNCKKSTDAEFLNNIKKLNIPKNDMLVFLNEGRLFYPQIQYFKEFTNNHLIMRMCSINGMIGYFGFNKAFSAQKFFVSINELSIFNDKVILNRGYRATHSCTEMTKQPEWLSNYTKTTSCAPTTGYASYYVIQDFLGVNEKDIVLVNFYGNEDNSTAKCEDHAWDYENEWLKSRNRIFC